MKRLIVFVSVISQLNVQHFRYDSCCRRTRFSFETHPFHKTFCTRLRNELCLFNHKHRNQSWKKNQVRKLKTTRCCVVVNAMPFSRNISANMCNIESELQWINQIELNHLTCDGIFFSLYFIRFVCTICKF